MEKIISCNVSNFKRFQMICDVESSLIFVQALRPVKVNLFENQVLSEHCSQFQQFSSHFEAKVMLNLIVLMKLKNLIAESK